MTRNVAAFGPMRVDELMLTRIAELLQHRRRVAWPRDLPDHIAFIEVATGRPPHAAAPLPLSSSRETRIADGKPV